MILDRRGFIAGLAAALAAPAIVRPGILMPVKRVLLSPGDGVALNSMSHPYLPAPTAPVGQIRPIIGDPPDGWLPTDGREVPREAYRELFAALGTNYGVGDGRTTFNIPDMRGALIGDRGLSRNTVAFADSMRHFIQARA